MYLPIHDLQPRNQSLGKAQHSALWLMKLPTYMKVGYVATYLAYLVNLPITNLHIHSYTRHAILDSYTRSPAT